MRRAIVAAALTVAASGAVFANDSSAALGAGGLTLTQSADIRMAREDLSISRDLVRVRYEFVNESGAPLTTRVAFPLPEADLELLTEADVGWPTESATNTVDFRVQVDGRAVTPVLEEKALLKGVEVTDVLRRLGVPISPRAHDVTQVLERLAAPAKAELVSRGLMRQSPGWVQPLWTVKNTYHWEQTFPTGRPLLVEHTYKPVVGGTIVPAASFFASYEELASYEFYKQFCIDRPTFAAMKSLLKGLKRRQGEGASTIAWFVDYVLTTGKNWKGPIGRFRLTLDKGRKSNVVSFCMKGVRKIGPTKFVVERRNFEPDEDLHVMILEKPQP
jgi:hypothetical protein